MGSVPRTNEELETSKVVVTHSVVQTSADKPCGLLTERTGDIAASFVVVVLAGQCSTAGEVWDAESCPLVVVWVCLSTPHKSARALGTRMQQICTGRESHVGFLNNSVSRRPCCVVLMAHPAVQGHALH